MSVRSCGDNGSVPCARSPADESAAVTFSATDASPAVTATTAPRAEEPATAIQTSATTIDVTGHAADHHHHLHVHPPLPAVAATTTASATAAQPGQLLLRPAACRRRCPAATAASAEPSQLLLRLAACRRLCTAAATAAAAVPSQLLL